MNGESDNQAIAQEIISLLGSQDQTERRRLMSYTEIKDKTNKIASLDAELFDPLVEILRTENNEGKSADAAFLLGCMGNKSAVPYLIQAINSESGEWLQSCAIIALGRLGDKRAVPKLASVLNDTQDSSQTIFSIRRFIPMSLGEIGDEAALPALLEAIDHLDESESLVHRFAINAITQITDINQASSILIKLLSHDKAYVRGFAATSLGYLAASSTDSVLRSRITHALINVLTDEGQSHGYFGTVSREAVRSLAFIDHPEGNKALEKWRKENRPDTNDKTQ